jgi:hypothetical protein
MMYPGDKRLNHKKGFCADGVASKLKSGSSATDSLPEWPQPQDIFSVGKFFNPSKFLLVIRDLYERVAENETQGRPYTITDYTLEDEAFSRMFQTRITIADGHTYFRLYDLQSVGGSCDSLISELDGHRVLRIDCL